MRILSLTLGQPYSQAVSASNPITLASRYLLPAPRVPAICVSHLLPVGYHFPAIGVPDRQRWLPSPSFSSCDRCQPFATSRLPVPINRSSAWLAAPSIGVPYWRLIANDGYCFRLPALANPLYQKRIDPLSLSLISLQQQPPRLVGTHPATLPASCSNVLTTTVLL